MRTNSRVSVNRRRAVTLLEVLTAIFILGIGLLALLALFPLGALSMAQSIKDDRAEAVAADAATFSRKGQDLLARTRQFVVVSAFNGSADPKSVSDLKEDFEDLAEEAAGLEQRIRELRPLARTQKAKRQVDQLLAQIRAIKSGLDEISELFDLFGQL